MHDVAAVAVQQRAEEVERASQVDVGDVHVPMPMRRERLHEAGPFLARRRRVPIEPARALQHAIDARGTDRHHVIVEHHEGQPAIAIQGMLRVVVEDRPGFPILKPTIAWHLAVVLVGLAVTLLPLVELARAQFQPTEQTLGG